MSKPEALWLAAALAVYLPKPQDMIDAAAELRRLHAENERCRDICAATSEGWRQDAEAWEAQRDALLEALKHMASIIDKMGDMPDEFIHPSPWQTLKCEEALTQARAAIKAVEVAK